MRRSVIVLVVLTILASGTTALATAPEPQFLESNKACQPITVRDAPDEATAVAFELPEGTRFKMGNRKVVGRTAWVNIRTKDGKIGWADGSLMCEGYYGIPPNLPTDATGNVEYREVVEVPGVAAAELYSRAKLWIAQAYRSAPDVIKLDDPAASTVVAKGIYEVSYTQLVLITVHVAHSLTIECKDGRYRATINQLRAQGMNAYMLDAPIDAYIQSYTSASLDSSSWTGWTRGFERH